MADFSSRGPCEDGGLNRIWWRQEHGSLRCVHRLDRIATPRNQLTTIHLHGGTSQAAPHVAGAAAVFCQYYRQTEVLSLRPP